MLGAFLGSSTGICWWGTPLSWGPAALADPSGPVPRPPNSALSSFAYPRSRRAGAATDPAPPAPVRVPSVSSEGRISQACVDRCSPARFLQIYRGAISLRSGERDLPLQCAAQHFQHGKLLLVGGARSLVGSPGDESLPRTR